MTGITRFSDYSNTPPLLSAQSGYGPNPSTSQQLPTHWVVSLHVNNNKKKLLSHHTTKTPWRAHVYLYNFHDTNTTNNRVRKTFPSTFLLQFSEAVSEREHLILTHKHQHLFSEGEATCDTHTHTHTHAHTHNRTHTHTRTHSQPHTSQS